MKKIVSYVIFLCMPIYMLVAMEDNRLKIDLKLIDDCNKTYSIARWKVVQDSSQADTLNIPGLTEQNITLFDKELDEIDLQVVQKNYEVLKLEIKKRIIGKPINGKPTGIHFPAYQEIFNYLLVSMIADNIAGNRVHAEKAYERCGPIDKLKTINGRVSVSDCDPDAGSYVALKVPFSTIECVGFNNSLDVCPVRVFTTKEDDSLDEYIGMVEYKAKNINGLGVTTDLKYLVATFDNNLVSKAALYSDEDYAAYKEITHNIKLADIYLLLHLYKAKKQGLRAELQNNEREYIRDYLTTNEKGKDLIKKHFL